MWYKVIRDSRNLLQMTEAKSLHTTAGVPIGPCGIEEAQKFQEYLSDFQILIYAAHLGNKHIFTGPAKPGKIKCTLG